MIKIKICGITNLEDAQVAVAAGADALGFVFYRKSQRYIAPEKARAIIRQLPQDVSKVGVFVNARGKTIKDIAKLCSLDILQFHGAESAEFCQKFKGYKIIKAFRINPALRSSLWFSTKSGVKDKPAPKELAKYRTFAYLFDTFAKDKAGGTGKAFNWELLKDIVADLKQPIFLSGGLARNNVQAAIKILHPAWVDVSSSVEIRPGKKDQKKVRDFISAAKSRPGLAPLVKTGS
ncbi:MAG: phosphoribosylanthranilate isomerase [Candidatus Omnitrophica bacterium]|nr:phosphoribosylanthranilate isomerase [Candidatus Omnitrophota bacterium]